MASRKTQDRIAELLKSLPKGPGVYLHKDIDDQIIYVGKAARLNTRVRQYFQKSRLHDPKTDLLVAEIADIEWTEVDSELDALFLEAELVRRYLPKYNILLRDDKSSSYVRINMQDKYPFISFVRRPLDDKATYIGPFFNVSAVRKALRALRKVFPYSTHRTLPPRVCLQYHLGLCPGVEESKISPNDYKNQLKQLIRYLRGHRRKVVKQFEIEMQEFSKTQNYEMATRRRNQLQTIKALSKQIIFSDKEFLDASKDNALVDTTNLLSLKKIPLRIEGYDISHMGGKDTVASMVVFSNGLPDKTAYRKFAMKLPGNDDFAHMREVMSRRFAVRNAKWPRPDLLLIDGGKGQLSSVLDIIRERGVDIPAVGLAKKQELIIIDKQRSNVTLQGPSLQRLKGFVRENDSFLEIDLPNNSHLIKFLQRIRDESHRFAVSYHTVLKRQSHVASQLDDIPGVGPITRKRLLKAFGSVSAIKVATIDELAKVVGETEAKTITTYLM